MKVIRVKAGDQIRVTGISDLMRKKDCGRKHSVVLTVDVVTALGVHDHAGWFVEHGCYEIISTANQSTPSHYAEQNGVACIDAIRAQLGRDGFIAFCRGNIAKYNWRLLQKGSVKADADKLADYARMLAKELEQ